MQDQILGLINPIMSGIFAATFVALWLRAPKDVHLLGFAAGSFGLGLGFLTFHYSDNPGDIVPSLTMHALYSMAVIATAWGAAYRVGQKIDVVAYGLGSLLAAAMITFACLARDENARLYAANGYYGLVFLLGAQSLTRAPGKQWIDKVIIGLFVATAVQFYVRPLSATIVNGSVDALGYRSSAFYSVLVVTVAVISLLLAMAFFCAAVLDKIASLKDESDSDHLTGINMRRAFESKAMDLLDESDIEKTPICMIVADLDHFKQVNDLWGHQTGDKAIATFGELLDRSIRDTDICGRIGGEEFCLVVRDCTLAQAIGLSERIRTSFAKIRHEGVSGNISLTASFGVAACRPGEAYGRLFARADAALYQAKEAGRDCVVSEADQESKMSLSLGKGWRSAAP